MSSVNSVPGEAVDDLYLKALPASTGPVRLALVQSAGFRRMRAAVPVIWANTSALPPAAATSVPGSGTAEQCLRRPDGGIGADQDGDVALTDNQVLDL